MKGMVGEYDAILMYQSLDTNHYILSKKKRKKEREGTNHSITKQLGFIKLSKVNKFSTIDDDLAKIT